MESIFSRTSLFELANMKSKTVVEVSIQTKPNNELINTTILGIISASIGEIGVSVSAVKTRQKVLLDLKNFVRIYSKVIAPSISDDGNIKFGISENKPEVVYGSCNNIIRVFPTLTSIGEMNYTNIEITAAFKRVKSNTGLNKIVSIIKEELM